MTAAGPLLERDTELAALRRLLADAERGDGAAVIVEGDAGIGRSALLAAAATIGVRRGRTQLGAVSVCARSALAARVRGCGVV